MAGFQLSINGRFWVSTEAFKEGLVASRPNQILVFCALTFVLLLIFLSVLRPDFSI